MARRIRPRVYQRGAVKDALGLCDSGKRVLVVSPGGSGKTVMIAMAAKQELEAGRKVLCLAHRREIVEQIKNHMGRVGLGCKKVGVIMAGEGENLGASVHVASIDTLHWRDYPEADTVLVDEAHHAPAPTWAELIDYYGARVVGFTATPYRLDGTGLGGVFDEMVEAIKPSEMLKRGWMSKPIIYVPKEEYLPNLRGIRLMAGDYHRAQLGDRMNSPGLVGGIVGHWMQLAKGRKTLVYAASVEHSQAIAGAFCADGIAAEHLDGNMSTGARKDMLSRFSDGETGVLSSCMLLSEGYDIPTCGAVVLARPTKSLALSIQQVNRGLRPNGKMRTVVLDHAMHYHSFGLPYADREFSLEGSQPRMPGHMMVKVCPECRCVESVFVTACSQCGYVFKERRVSAAVTDIDAPGVLEQLTDDKILKYVEKLRAVAAEKGADEKWVQKVFGAWIEARMGD